MNIKQLEHQLGRKGLALPGQVRKRDGSIVTFDPARIQRAVERCYASVEDEPPTQPPETIARGAINAVAAMHADAVPCVEDIQDIVELTLLSAGEFTAARAYIHYRETRKQQRGVDIPAEVRAAFDADDAFFPTVIQKFQFYDKYSRFNWELGRRETWTETVDRVVDYLAFLSDGKLDVDVFERIRNAILRMQVMPSMRALAMAGAPAKRNSLAIYNCSALPVLDIHSFIEALLISFAGCGVGFSVESEYVDQFPRVKRQKKSHDIETHVVEDSTEGWGEALREGLTKWWAGEDVKFDYSLVRPAGTPLLIKGGRASGPEPLRLTLDRIRLRLLARQGTFIRPIDALDIMCWIGDAAVSGGVRRTAMICLFDWWDHEVREAKNGAALIGNEQRWNSNNSVVWPENLTALDVMRQMLEMAEGNRGEPGIFSRENAIRTKPKRRKRQRFLTNPCLSGDTLVMTTEGPKRIDSLDQPFWAVVDGEAYAASASWCSGTKPIFLLETQEGHRLRLTEDHKVLRADGVMVPAADLSPGDYLVLSDRLDQQPLVARMKSLTPDGIEPVFDLTVDTVHVMDANGIIVKNCGEVILRPNGLCNLSIAVARNDDTIDTLREKVEIATIIGTIQSLATNFPGLRPEWKQNCEEERLLGVDITGQLDCPVVQDAGVLAELKQLAIETNETYAAALGINASAAITVNKPSGNSSQLLDCASGIHARWAPFYIRNIRVSAHTPLFRVLRDAGVPMDPENGQTARDATTWVIHFPVKAPEGAVTSRGRSAIEQCNYWLLNKENWTEHNPSCTINYHPTELIELSQWVWEHRDRVGGLAFLPTEDQGYSQLPYEEITADQYQKAIDEFPEVDFARLFAYETEDMTTAAQELACLAGSCDL